MNFIHSAVNQLFAAFCGAVYGILILVYKLFYSISNTGLIEESFTILAKNVYTILGVLMIFKLAFSIIQYIIDPDQFYNKENGFSSIIKNVFVVLVLILAVPIVFNQAKRLQIIILNEDIVGRVITGKNMASLSSTNQANNANYIGKQMAFNVLSGFVRPNEDLTGCESTLNSNSIEFDNCINSIRNVDQTAASTYETALKSTDYTLLLSPKLMFSSFTNSQGEKTLTFDFNGIFALICGGFVVYILFIFCMDIAVRSVKLSFLQIIAPIPIVSYIDPKSKKQVFDKWVKMSVSTYLDLFIRLAAIYFAVYLIQCILDTGLETTTMDANGNMVTSQPGPFVIIFMILGLLMFAKQLPNIIKDLTGLDLGGKFTLNPLKKIQDEALFGKQVAAGVGFAGRTGKNLAIGTGALIGKPIGALLGVAGKKIGTGVSEKFNEFRSNHAGIDGALNFAGKAGNKIGSGLGYVGTQLGRYGNWTGAGKYFSRIGNDAQDMIGGLTQKSVNAKMKEMENIYSEMDGMFKHANGEMIKYDNLKFQDNAGNNVTMKDFKVAKEYLKALEAQDTRGMTSSQLAAHAEEMKTLRDNINKTEKKAEQAYIDAIRGGTLEQLDENGNLKLDDNGQVMHVEDSEIMSRSKNIDSMVKNSTNSEVRKLDTSSGKNLKESKDKLNNEIVNQKGSQRYRSAQNK